MSTRRIRFYSGKTPEYSVIGFDKEPRTDGALLQSFLAERGYAWLTDAEAPEQSISSYHVEIRPPLSEEHLKELGETCIRSSMVTQMAESSTSYTDEVYLLNNLRDGIGQVINNSRFIAIWTV